MLSSGGMGNLPSIHQDFLAHGWATDRQFGEALAIGQLAPGPNGLWVVAFGYFTGGYLGSALAAVAMTLPPLLVIPLDRLHGRYAEVPAVRGFVAGLSLAVAASIPVVFLRVVNTFGLDLLGIALIAASLLLMATRKLPTIAVLALGAAAGAVVFR